MQLSRTFTSLLIFVAASSAAPFLSKRINQTTIDSVQNWENACDAAGGGTQCNPIAVTAAATLLANAGPCDQQDSADTMIDVAKTLNNNPAMITAAQIFAQSARNTPNSVAVVYCQTAPKNPELNGLFQCQFEGANQKLFTNGAAVGAPGTIPLGLTAPVNPLGSCPAHPQGPIPDGVQLSSLVTSPGTPASSSGAAPAPAAASPAPAASSPSSSAGDTSFPPPQQSSSASTASASTGSATGFQLGNGQEAQQQNKQFSSLTASSSCQEGSQACVNSGFAQCVGGKFVVTQCAGGTQCFALPLVNKAGTSITCTTQSDATSRIANTGATGGITGSGSAAPAPAAASPAASPAAAAAQNAAPAPAPAPAASTGFQLSNGQQAQSLNKQFAGLTAGSSCTEGQDACVDSGFAQCVGGKFVTTQCAAGTQCFALPLVNKAGTSVACTTQSDASSRIANTGATGGITGSPSARAVASGFQLSNGQQAQSQNKQFAGLNAGSSCSDGEEACVNSGFAQCVGGKFVVTQCPATTQCFALPLVNKAGTSITCTTQSDASSRIANTGATGGINGS